MDNFLDAFEDEDWDQSLQGGDHNIQHIERFEDSERTNYILYPIIETQHII